MVRIVVVRIVRDTTKNINSHSNNNNNSRNNNQSNNNDSISKAPKGNGIGATGSKNWVWFQEPFALVLRTLCPRF